VAERGVLEDGLLLVNEGVGDVVHGAPAMACADLAERGRGFGGGLLGLLVERLRELAFRQTAALAEELAEEKFGVGGLWRHSGFPIP
jgi:hypothetical protein